MKRSEIKVGEVYGVRLQASPHVEVMPAKVVALDEPYEYVHRYSTNGTPRQEPKGGIRVRFMKPTRVSGRSLSDAARTNDFAGPITEEYVFGDLRNGGSAAKCFVGVWSELEAKRKAQEQGERDELARWRGIAEEFAPILDDYRQKLALVGLKTRLHADSTGVTGDVGFSLRATTIDGKGNRAPVGFGYDEVRVPKSVFDQLVDFAAEHGFKRKRGS